MNAGLDELRVGIHQALEHGYVRPTTEQRAICTRLRANFP